MCWRSYGEVLGAWTQWDQGSGRWKGLSRDHQIILEEKAQKRLYMPLHTLLGPDDIAAAVGKHHDDDNRSGGPAARTAAGTSTAAAGGAKVPRSGGVAAADARANGSAGARAGPSGRGASAAGAAGGSAAPVGRKRSAPDAPVPSAAAPAGAVEAGAAGAGADAAAAAETLDECPVVAVPQYTLEQLAQDIRGRFAQAASGDAWYYQLQVASGVRAQAAAQTWPLHARFEKRQRKREPALLMSVRVARTGDAPKLMPRRGAEREIGAIRGPNERLEGGAFVFAGCGLRLCDVRRAGDAINALKSELS